MQKTKLWLIGAVAMIVIGIILLAILEVVYVPRIQVYGAAAAAWSQNATGVSPPNPEEYGLNSTAMVLASVMGLTSTLRLIVGIAVLVIALVARIISRTRI